MRQRYEFEEFSLDPGENLLLRDGEPVKLTPRLLALLVALVERPGRLVEKQRLLDQVWEGTAVTEANLTVQVSKLRRILGETEDRIFIETVPTRGYRFLLPVHRVEEYTSPIPMRASGSHPTTTGSAPADESLPMPARLGVTEATSLRSQDDGQDASRRIEPVAGPAPAVSARGRSKLWAALAGLLLTFVAGFVALRFVRAGPPVPEGRAPSAAPAAAASGPGAVRLTAHVADDGEPSWSPDGSTIVFSSNREGPQTLHLMPADGAGGGATRLATSHPASAPVWSPDGERLAFVCLVSGRADLCVVDRSGANERRLTSTPEDELEPAWSPDGRELAYARVNGRQLELHAIDVSTTVARRVGPADWSILHPAWSPDGRRIAVARWVAEDNYDLWVVPVDGAPPLRVLESSEGEFDPEWSPDGRTLAFFRVDGLYTVPASGGVATRVPHTQTNDRDPAWAADGRSLVFESQRDGNGEIYRVAVGAGELRLTDALGADKDPAWSPDGRRLAFASNRDGRYEIYLMNTDGSGLTRLTDNDDADERPTWSPRGDRLAFMRERRGVTDIYVLDLATRRERLLTPQEGSDSEPQWSPDGTRIAFNSSRDGNFEVYVMAADGANQVNVTRHPGRDTYPAWSPDSRRLVFASNRGTTHFFDNDLYIVSADGRGEPKRLTHTPEWDAFPTWSPDGVWIAFVRSFSERHDLLRVEVATGTERFITREGANEDTPSWSPDGRRLAFFSNKSGNADVYVMDVGQ